MVWPAVRAASGEQFVAVAEAGDVENAIVVLVLPGAAVQLPRCPPDLVALAA